MNIQQIEYIIAVSELRNFGQAADKCCITQSTLSTMIGRFEDEIGINIFDRKTKPVTVTAEGEEILRQLKVISRELESLSETVQMLKGELSGELKIGVIPTVAPFLLPRFLNDFASQFPSLKISVSERNTATIKDLISKRELDIGILAIPLEMPDFVETPLYNEVFALYDCESDCADTLVSLENMTFERFWLLEEGHCLRTQVQKICDFGDKTTPPSINFEFKAGSIDSLIRFVRMNNGKTLLPDLAMLDFSEEEMRRVSYFKDPVPVRAIGLVVHRHFVKKQILELLRKAIQDKIIPLLRQPSGTEEVFSPL